MRIILTLAICATACWAQRTISNGAIQAATAGAGGVTIYRPVVLASTGRYVAHTGTLPADGVALATAANLAAVQIATSGRVTVEFDAPAMVVGNVATWVSGVAHDSGSASTLSIGSAGVAGKILAANTAACANCADVAFVQGASGGLSGAVLGAASLTTTGCLPYQASSGTVTCNSGFTYTGTGASGAIFTDNYDNSTGDAVAAKELVLKNTATSANVLALMNLSTSGFSAVEFRSNANVATLAMGYGNASSIVPLFVGTNYIESWNKTGVPPRLVVSTDGNYGSGYAFYQRQSFETDGTVKFWKLISYASAQVEIMGIKPGGTVYLAAPTATANGDVLEIRADSSTWATGAQSYSTLIRLEQVGITPGSLLAYTSVANTSADGMMRTDVDNASATTHGFTSRNKGSGYWFRGDDASTTGLLYLSPNSGTPAIGSTTNIRLLPTGSIQLGGSDLGYARNAVGVMEINSGTAGTFRDLILRSPIWTGTTAPTLANSQCSVSLTNNTTITFTCKGSDATTRTGTITIS